MSSGLMALLLPKIMERSERSWFKNSRVHVKLLTNPKNNRTKVSFFFGLNWYCVFRYMVCQKILVNRKLQYIGRKDLHLFFFIYIKIIYTFKNRKQFPWKRDLRLSLPSLSLSTPYISKLKRQSVLCSQKFSIYFQT